MRSRKKRSGLKQPAGSRIFDVINVILMIFIIAVCIYPFIYIFSIALNDNSVSSWTNIVLFPKAVTFDNFKVILRSPELLSGYKVSILRVVIGTTLSVFLSGAMAYALSRKELVGRTFFNIFIIVPMYLTGGIVATYMLYRAMHLLDTFAVLVLGGLLSSMNIILMRTYFMSLPDGLIESAKIDGANDFLIYLKIVFPVSKPIYATIALFTAVGYWNDWFAGDMFITSRNLLPIQTQLQQIINTTKANEMMLKTMAVTDATLVSMQTSVKMAAVLLTVIPIVMVYPFLQKHFVKGIMIGSLKG